MTNKKDAFWSDKDYNYYKQGDREKCRDLLFKYNKIHPNKAEKLKKVLYKLIPSSLNKNVIIRQPFTCYFGYNIQLADKVHIGQNVTMLDSEKIEIGEETAIACNVVISTTSHPMEQNRRHEQINKPIVIGKNVCIYAGAIITSGITIGDNAVIGAGAVVTKDVPANAFVAGVPAKIVKMV